MKRLSIISLSLVLILSLFSCEPKEEPVIKVSSIILNSETLSMTEGDTFKLTATVNPQNATNKMVAWSSSNASIASVEDGMVTAVKEGTATITATSRDGGAKASCTVTVSSKAIAVQSITLDQTKVEMTVGESLALAATVKPDDATDKAVTWKTSDANIASVDQSGKVTAIGEGSATITAKAGDKEATCLVTVSIPVVPVESITLDQTNVEMAVGESLALTATVKPDNATDKTVTWNSSNANIASVDQNGKVTAMGEGSATITAKAGDKEATCLVTVTIPIVPVESITLDQTAVSLEEGQTITLKATVKPDNATNKTVTWNSSDDNVAMVDQSGIVVAIKAGEALITASVEDKSVTCIITVKDRPLVNSISLSESDFNAFIDRYYSLTAELSPAEAKYDLEWTVSDERVAEIIGSGTNVRIHTKDFGKTNIVVTDILSGVSASLSLSTIVTDFSWNESTTETYFGDPVITLGVGSSHKLLYSCTPPYATHLFEDLSNFVFYEPTYVVDTPSVISIDSEGNVTAIKEGMIGIKPTGLILKGQGPDRVYINVVSEINEKEYNDESDLANAASYGIPMKFTISSATDVDWFKLPLPKGGTTTIRITLTYEDAALLGSESRLVKYAVYDSDLTQWGAGSFSFDSKTLSAVTERTVMTNDCLYLKVFFDPSYPMGLRPTGILTLTYEEL